MSELEFDLIDELYFLTEYKQLKDNWQYSEIELQQTLRDCIQKMWVHQYAFNQQLSEFEKSFSPDYNNLENYSYLATKQSLLLHNGISLKI